MTDGGGQPGPPGGDAPWWSRPDGGEAPSWWNEPNQGGWQQPGPGQGMPFSARPDPAFAASYSRHPMGRAKGAVPALVCGILALVCCGIVLGPIAIYQGSQARYRVRASNGRLSGDGMALAGMLLGIVAIGLFVIGVVLAATGHRFIVISPTTTTIP